jgi:hypothetical protein
LKNGQLKPKLTGAVAHAIAEKLVSGTINPWELPLAHKQLQRGLPELVYLAGMTFIASNHQRTPPFSKVQIEFFNELQKLFNLKKRKPLENPALFTLNEFFIPPQEAQDIIDVQIMRHQTLYEKQTNSTQSESLQANNTCTNAKKKRGKKKNPKKRNNKSNNITEELRPAENNEWLEKLQQVLHTQNSDIAKVDGDDLPMLCQPVINEEDTTTTASSTGTTASNGTSCRQFGARNCTALYQDMKRQEDKTERASFVNFTVEQFHALVAHKGANRYGVPFLQTRYSSDEDSDENDGSDDESTSDENSYEINPLAGMNVDEILLMANQEVKALLKQDRDDTPIDSTTEKEKSKTDMNTLVPIYAHTKPMIDKETSLNAKEEVAMALLNNEDDLMPPLNSSELEENEVNNCQDDATSEPTVKEKKKEKGLVDKGTSVGSETKETVNQQDESIVDADRAISMEPQVAAQAIADSAEPQQHGTNIEIQHLHDQLKKLQSKLEEKDFTLEVQAEMLAEKEALLKSQKTTLEEVKSRLKKEQEGNKSKQKTLKEQQTMLLAQKASMEEMNDLLNQVQATNKELLSKLKKSEARNRALHQAFQQYNCVVAKIEQSDE